MRLLTASAFSRRVLLAALLVLAGALSPSALGFHENLPPVLRGDTGRGSGWHAVVLDVPPGGEIALEVSATGGRGPVQLGLHLASVDDAINWTEVAEAWAIGSTVEGRGQGRLPPSSFMVGGGPHDTTRASLHVRSNASLAGAVRALVWTSGAHDEHSWSVRATDGVRALSETGGSRTFLFTLDAFDRVDHGARVVPLAGERVLVDADHGVRANGALFATFHKSWYCQPACEPTTGTMSWTGPDGQARAPASSGFAVPDASSDGFLRNGTWQDDSIWVIARAGGDHTFRLQSEYMGDDRFLLGGADVTLPAWP